MLNFEYQSPTKVIFGSDSLDKLGAEVICYEFPYMRYSWNCNFSQSLLLPVRELLGVILHIVLQELSAFRNMLSYCCKL